MVGLQEAKSAFIMYWHQTNWDTVLTWFTRDSFLPAFPSTNADAPVSIVILDEHRALSLSGI